MSNDEKKPILQDSVGIYMKPGGSYEECSPLTGQQHLTIQPIEFDYKHRNIYGYLALASSILLLINYLIIKERTCQWSLVNGFQNYDLIQSFHMTAFIVSLIVFILSYFNFAMVIHEFKLLFYSSAALILICAGLLIYNAIAITSAPCVPLQTAVSGFIMTLGASATNGDKTNIFSAHDASGITVFLFDLIAASLLFLTGRQFYQRR